MGSTGSWVCLRPMAPDVVEGWLLPPGERLNLARVCALLPSAIAGGTNVRLTVLEDGLWVDDRGGRRGVYVPLLESTELSVGDELLVGRTLIRILPVATQPTAISPADLTRPDGSTARMRLAIQSVFSGPVTVVEVEDDEAVIGGSDGDVVVVDDPDMSAVHALLQVTPTGVQVTDLDSCEGTFRRARHGEVVPLGFPMVVDHILLTTERFYPADTAPFEERLTQIPGAYRQSA